MAEAQAQEPPLCDKAKRRLANILRKKPGKKFNVLIVGMPGSGKSSFINSMSMAVTGTWKEVAHYSQSDSSVTKCLERYIMFDENCHEVHEPHPIPDYNNNIIFWDCAGFPDATEEAYSTIVYLTLDGRIPSGTNIIDCMDQTPDELRSKFRSRVDHQMTFDRVVFILSADKVVPNNLVEAIKSGAQQGHDVPIMVVVTKEDKCPNRLHLQKRIEEALAAFKLTGNQVRFKITSLYCEELTPWPDRNDYRVMKPNADIDKNLLNIWMSLTDPNIKVKPAPPPPTPQPQPKSSCVLS